MKIIVLIVGLLLITTFAFAEVSGICVGYEREMRNGKPFIKVLTSYTYPDGSKRIGVTRYTYANFSKENVLRDIEQHVKTIVTYYIEGNTEAMLVKEIEVVDELLADQAEMGLSNPDRILLLKSSLESLYIDGLDMTIEAEGEIRENYK